MTKITKDEDGKFHVGPDDGHVSGPEPNDLEGHDTPSDRIVRKVHRRNLEYQRREDMERFREIVEYSRKGFQRHLERLEMRICELYDAIADGEMRLAGARADNPPKAHQLSQADMVRLEERIEEHSAKLEVFVRRRSLFRTIRISYE